MNSGARNAAAIALGVGCGLLALLILSGGYSASTMLVPASLGTSEATPAFTSANPSLAPTNNQENTIAGLVNPTPYTLTIIILAAVSLLIALGASVGVSRRVDKYK